MDTIAEKVVSLALDNAGFKQGAEETVSSIESMEKAFSGLGSNISTRAFETFVESITDYTHNIETAVNTVIVRITDSVYDAVSKITSAINQVTLEPIFSGFSKYESQVASVQTMMTATGKSIDTVTEQLQKLMWFADETSYSYSQMTSSIGKFVSAGVDLEDATTALIGIANWAGAAGANANEASRAMYNLSQAMGSGAVTMKDWISVVSANMSTADFKQSLVDTAKEYVSWGNKYKTFVDQYGINSAKFKEIAESNGHTVEEATKFYEYFKDAKLPKDIGGWGNLTSSNLEASLSSKWLTSDILLQTLKKYGNYTEDLYNIYNSGDFDTANEAIEAYHEQYDAIVDKLFDIYVEYGKNSKQFKDVVTENAMTMQTALDLLDSRKNQLLNAKLEKDAEEFKKLAETYGRESQNLADAAKKSGLTLSEALDIIDNGTDNYKKKEMSRGEEGFRKGQEAKTFSDAWGAAIEATQTQWLRLWETVFGNYEEAKITWTELANTLWDVFAGPLDQINSIMDVWKESEGRDILLEAIENVWDAAQRMVEPFKNAFNEIFPFINNIDKMGEFVYNLTNEINKFTASLGLSTNTFIYLRVIAESVLTTIKNIFTVLGVFKEAIRNIIAALLPGGDGALSFIAELSLQLFKLTEYVDDISIAIAQKTGMIIGKIEELKSKLFPIFDFIKNTILFTMGFSENLSMDFLDKLANSKHYEQILKIKDSIDKLKNSFAVLIEQFKNVDTSRFNKLMNFLKPVADFVGDKLVSGLLFVIQLIVEIMNLITRLSARILGFKGSWDSSIGTTVSNLLNLESFIDTIKTVFEAIRPVIDMVVETIKRVILYVVDAISKVDLFKAAIAALVLQVTGISSSLLTVFKDENWLSLTKIKAAIKNFFKFDTVKDSIKKFSGFIQDTIGEISKTLNQIPYLESVSRLLESIGKSLLMIAGAALLFSSIPDAGSFVGAIGAITAAITSMFLVIKGFSTIQTVTPPESFGGGILGQLQRTFFGVAEAMQMDVISVQLLAFSSSILLLSVAALNVSKIIKNAEHPITEMILCLGSLYLMLVALYAFIEESNKLMIMPSIIPDGAQANAMFLQRFVPLIKLLNTLVGVLIPMTVLMKVIGGMKIDQIGKGLFGLAAMIGFLYAGVEGIMKVVTGMVWVGPESVDVFKIAGNNIVKTARSMILMAMAVGILAIPMAAIGKMNIGAIAKGIIGTVLLAGELFGVTIGFAKLIKPDQIKSVAISALSVIGIASAVMTMAVAMIALGKMLNGDELVIAIDAMTVIFMVLLGSLGAISLIVTDSIGPILAGAGAMMMVSAAVDIMITGMITLLYVFSKIPEEDRLESFVYSIGSLVSMWALLMGSLKVISMLATPDMVGPILAAAGSMVLIGIAMDTIAIAVIGMAKQGTDISMGILGLLGVLGLLTIFMRGFTLLPLDTTKLALLGLSMTTIGIGLNFVAMAAEKFSGMNWDQILATLGGMSAILVTVAVVSSSLSNLWAPMVAFGLAVAAVGAGLILIGMGIDTIHNAMQGIASDPYVREFGDFLVENLVPGFENLGEVIEWCREQIEDFWNALLSEEKMEAVKNFFKQNPVMAAGFGINLVDLYGKNQNGSQPSNEQSASTSEKSSGWSLNPTIGMGLGGGLVLKNIPKPQKEEVEEAGKEDGKTYAEAYVESVEETLEASNSTITSVGKETGRDYLIGLNNGTLPSTGPVNPEIFKNEEAAQQAGKTDGEQYSEAYKKALEMSKWNNGSQVNDESYKKTLEMSKWNSGDDRTHATSYEEFMEADASELEKAVEETFTESDLITKVEDFLLIPLTAKFGEWGGASGEAFLDAFVDPIKTFKPEKTGLKPWLFSPYDTIDIEGGHTVASKDGKQYVIVGENVYDLGKVEANGEYTPGSFLAALAEGAKSRPAAKKAIELYTPYINGFDENIAAMKPASFARYGTIDVEDSRTIATRKGKTYVIMGDRILELGKWDAASGNFTAGSYLESLAEGAKQHPEAQKELEKYVVFDSAGNVTQGYWNYADVNDTTNEHWEKWQSALNREAAKEVETGIKGWIESRGLSTGLTEYLNKSAANFANKLGLSGNAFDVNDAIAQFQSSWGASTSSDGTSDPVAFAKNLEEAIAKLTNTTDGYGDTVTDTEDATKKATKATKSLNSAQQEYNSKLREFESLMSSYTSTLTNFAKDIGSGFGDIFNELKAENAASRGDAYANAFIAAANNAFKRNIKEQQEQEKAERITANEDAREVAEVMKQDTNIQIRAANMYREDASYWESQANSQKQRAVSAAKSAMAEVDRYNKTNRSGQIKATRTMASETDPDYWRSKANEVGSALSSLENEILDSDGYYKKGVTQEQIRLHQTLLDANKKITKILDEYDRDIGLRDRAWNKYTTVYDNVVEEQGDTRKENDYARERLFYTDPKNREKLSEDYNDAVSELVKAKEEFGKNGYTVEDAKRDKERMTYLESVLFDKFGNLKFGVDRKLVNEYNRLQEGAPTIEKGLQKITDLEDKVDRLNGYMDEVIEEENERIQRDEEYNAQLAAIDESEGTITDEMYSLSRSQLNAAYDANERRINELNDDIAVLEAELSGLDKDSSEYKDKNDKLNKAESDLRGAIGLRDSIENYGKIVREQQSDATAVDIIEKSLKDGISDATNSISMFGTTVTKESYETWSGKLSDLKDAMDERAKDIYAINNIGDWDILENEEGAEENPYLDTEVAKPFAGIREASEGLSTTLKETNKNFAELNYRFSLFGKTDEEKAKMPYKTFDDNILAALAIFGMDITDIPSEASYTKAWEKKNNVTKVKDEAGNERYVDRNSDEAKEFAEKGYYTTSKTKKTASTTSELATTATTNANAARDRKLELTQIPALGEGGIVITAINATNDKLDDLLSKFDESSVSMSNIQNGIDTMANSGIYLDGKTLIGRMAPDIDKALGGFAFRRGMV